jgi:glycyl-tRNA synthetase
MEMQYFVKPGEDETWFDFWKEQRMAFYHKMGINPESLRWHKHGDDELAFYAKDAYDIQFLFPMGWQELEGVHNRTNYDLTQHQTFSGKDLSYLDQETNERYVPYVVETSAGLTRNVLMALSDAYEEEKLPDGDTRTVLHFHPKIAPITVAVLPLVKKDGISEKAQKLEKELREDFATFYDQSGAIGRRYRRMDEIGTPYCVTLDYQTLTDNTVTVRYRDSMEQERVAIDSLTSHLMNASKNYKRG